MKRFLLSYIAIYSITFFYYADAQLSVSYQPYEATEMVFKYGIYTMKGKDFAKCGLEAVKVTVKNEGTEDDIFRPDRPGVTIDKAYACLSYSMIPVCLISETLAASIACGIVTGTLFFIDPWFVNLRKFSDEFNKDLAAATKQSTCFSGRVEKIFEYLSTTGFEKARTVIAGKVCYLIAAGAAFVGLSQVPPCCCIYAYGFNYVLRDFLYRELIYDAIVVAPGASIQKVLLIQKSSDLK